MLEIEGLEVRYGGVRAVRGVDFVVRKGQIVGIVGPNGAGKSSLLNAVAGVVRPSAGRITWDGRPLTGRRPYELARTGVALVPEGRGVFRTLSVAENLATARFAGRTAAWGSALDPVIGLFPILGERLAQPAGSLSGGEQQMLVIARALLLQPELLLIDELSLGLALRVVAQLYAVLRSLNQDGLTIVVVEQHLPAVVGTAHHLYALARGEIAAHGNPAGVAADLTRSFGETEPGRLHVTTALSR